MDIEYAIRIAELWREGKMIGADEDEIRETLLAKVEKDALELEAWRNRFPGYEYRAQDDCIAIKTK